MNDTRRLSAVVTTFRPDRGFVSRFAPLLELCDHVVVVDNTPGGCAFDDLPGRFHLIQDGTNRGLGPALNRGILRAKGLGAEYVVLFDQDSTPGTQTVAQLLSLCRSAQERLGDRCAVGPTHVDDVTGLRAEPRMAKRADADLHDVTCLPTSGLLFPLREIDADALFASDLFLDLVDFEWCWRQRGAGWRFLRATGEIVAIRAAILEQMFRMIGHQLLFDARGNRGFIHAHDAALILAQHDLEVRDEVHVVHRVALGHALERR